MIELCYCNFSKAMITLKSKSAQIKINLLHGLINQHYNNINELI